MAKEMLKKVRTKIRLKQMESIYEKLIMKGSEENVL